MDMVVTDMGTAPDVSTGMVLSMGTDTDLDPARTSVAVGTTARDKRSAFAGRYDSSRTSSTSTKTRSVRSHASWASSRPSARRPT